MQNENPLEVTSENGLCRTLRLNDGRFHLLKAGPMANFYYGGDHLLVSEVMAEIFRDTCDHCVDLIPTEIINSVTDECLGKYYELAPREKIMPQKMRTTTESAFHAWRRGQGGLVVSPSVAEALRQAGINDVHFSMGPYAADSIGRGQG